MLQECKYRLPCDWCEKFNEICIVVETKLQIEKDKHNKKECEHEWICGGDCFFDEVNNQFIKKYICKKCNETEFRV